MIEFGSDFHYIDSYFSGRAHLTDVYRNAMLMADGRQSVVALIRQNGWKRLWMPEYFCYEVIETIKQQTEAEIEYYHDLPGCDDASVIKQLPFEGGDALFRVNYFGTRDGRSNKDISVPVIEDHTHDLLGHWALYSDADWCIASLRKTLPVPMGGMVWGPKGFKVQGSRFKDSGLKIQDSGFKFCEEIAAERWEGMEMKAHYLKGETVEKEAFRKKYLETEDWFDVAEPIEIDARTKDFLGQLDINAWQGAKRRNWELLRSLVNAKCLLPEDDSCTPFSFVVMADSRQERERLRKRLIERAVYPAVLWNVPDTVSREVKDFSERMLSIHCDGRYTEDDIRQLAVIINEAIEK